MAKPSQTKAIQSRMGKKSDSGKCNCWEGYDRAPGSKPCAPGSCVKMKGK
jgi:hypothetical protein